MQLRDFHVEPTCSPTCNGVWHTIHGRSMIHPAELTLAQIFQANGYAAARVGDWKKCEGYRTDFWFREAALFVEEKRMPRFFSASPRMPCTVHS